MFLVGRHDAKKYAHFVDDLLTEFSFKTIQFVNDDVPKNEAGIIFKYKDRLLLDNPEYLLVMRYKVCSSFPIHELIQFHKEKEQLYGCSEDDDEDALANGNKALVSVMTTRFDHVANDLQGGQKAFGVFGINEATHEVLHYTEENEAVSQMVKTNPDSGIKIQPPINCGIYLFSTRIYEEFGLPR